jgi:hypothetical protein
VPPLLSLLLLLLLLLLVSRLHCWSRPLELRLLVRLH